MNNSNISSNISPKEIAELNNEDARQIDVALGVIINEIPSKIASIKNLLDEVDTNINSLKTRDLSFDINSEIANLTKDYDVFSQDVLNYASYYELQIINIINIFDKMNSLDGSLTVDNNFFKNLPFLGTILFTLLTYDKKELFAQFVLDMTGNVMDKDFNESLGNLAYNTTEFAIDNYITTHLTTSQTIQSSKFLISNGVAATGLILVESLYGILYQNTDHSQDSITMINAIGDGTKLVAGNIIAQSVALPAAITIGGPIGIAVGAGTIVLSEIGLDYCIDNVCAELSGEAFIPGTSIPKNGGKMSLYSNYLKAAETNNYNYGSIGRTTSLNGMTVSAEYCRGMAQLDPVATLSGLDDFDYVEGSTWAHTLDNYLTDLSSISPNSSNFNEQVDLITEKALAGYGDGGMSSEYVNILVNDFGFDPYSYAKNN